MCVDGGLPDLRHGERAQPGVAGLVGCRLRADEAQPAYEDEGGRQHPQEQPERQGSAEQTTGAAPVVLTDRQRQVEGQVPFPGGEHACSGLLHPVRHGGDSGAGLPGVRLRRLPGLVWG